MCVACLRNAGHFMAPVVNALAGSEYLRCLNSKQIFAKKWLELVPPFCTEKWSGSRTIGINRESVMTDKSWTLFEENVRV